MGERKRKKKRIDKLREELARLQGDDEDFDDEDLEDSGEELAEDRGSGLMRLVGGSLGEKLAAGLGALADLSRVGVEDLTAPGHDGERIPFKRHMGRVRNVKLDGDGKVKEVDFEPEEWPPRRRPGETF